MGKKEERTSENSETILVDDDIKPPVKPTLKEQGYIPARYIITFISFLGFFINFHIRTSLNLAIVTMAKPTNESHDYNIEDTCNFKQDNETISSTDGDFEWDEWVQGLITGSFYWTYVICQIPAGHISNKFGSKMVLGIGTLISGVLSLLMPLSAHLHYSALIVIRMLMGICLSPTYPATHTLLAKWAPPNERSIIVSFVFTGVPAATIIGYPMAAAVIQSWGWEFVFYMQGILALVWSVLWILIISNSPQEFRWITTPERKYICESIGDSVDTEKTTSVPWLKIIKSPSIWAILVASMGDNWGFFTLLTDLPLYMKNMMKMDINANAVLSAMPYVGMWISSIVICLIADLLIGKNILSTTVVRKIVNTITQAGPAICLMCIPLVECSRPGVIALLFVAVTLNGGTGAGYEVNILDLSPNYAGPIYGAINALGSAPAFLAPMAVGALTKGMQTNARWQIVFYLSSIIYLVDSVFYIIFGSGKEQSWNRL